MDFRALARTAELVEPATEGTPGTGAGGTGAPCSYCGGTYFEPTEDNGRALRAECEECGGTMVSHDGAYWQPDLIGSPHNHPSTAADPASGGVGGAGAAPVKVREEDLSSRTAGANGSVPEGLEVAARPFPPGSDEHNDLESSYPGGKHGVVEAFVPERDDPIGSMEFSATPEKVHVHLTMVHDRYRRRGVATALNAKLREIYPDHPIDRGAATEDGEHFRHSLGGVDWCRHRHAEHCWLPSNYASPPGLALWTPQDRGVCPWATASQQQINCPMSEPGPMAGMTRAAARGEDVGPLLPVKHAKKVSLIDPELAFHFLAAWRDVRAKAVRIRRAGGVSIVSVLVDGITGHVNGDTAVYETQINYVPGTLKIGFWQCGCAWAAYAWGRSPAYRRFEGRLCSHALALVYEAQSRGMFGREVAEDTQRPSWMRQRTPVQVDYDRDDRTRRNRRAVPPANMRRTYEGSTHQAALDPDGVYPSDHGLSLDRRPIEAFAAVAYQASGDPADAMRVFLAAGLDHTAARDLLADGLRASSEVWAALLREHPQLQNLEQLGDHLQVAAALPAGPCPTCRGTGINVSYDEEENEVTDRCDDCEGTGHVGAVSDEELAEQDRREVNRRAQRDADHLAKHHANGEGVGSACPGWCPVARQRRGAAAHQASLDVSPVDSVDDPAHLRSTQAVVETDDSLDFAAPAALSDLAHLGSRDLGVATASLDPIANVVELGAGDQVSQVLAGREIAGVSGDLAGVAHVAGVGPTVGLDHARLAAGAVGAVPEQPVSVLLPGAGPRMAGGRAARAVDLGLVAEVDADGLSTSADPGALRHVADTSKKKTDENWNPPTHAGVVLKAADTGRILMIQRSNKDPDDPAAGTWEWPGGGREEEDHNSLHSALREFQEEVGQPFPLGGHVSHVWQSPNGVYQGHVVVVPSEDCLDFANGRATTNPDDPDGDDHEQSAWWDPAHAEKNPALRPECRDSPWKQIKAASLAHTAGMESDGETYPAHAVFRGNSDEYFGAPQEELARYKKSPARARFRLEQVPIAHMRQHTIEGIERLPKYHELDDGDPDDRERLDRIEHAMDQGRGVRPGIAIHHNGDYLLIDGRHRAAVHEQRGHTHMPVFVTDSDPDLNIYRRMAGQRTADYASHDTLGDFQPDWRPKAPPEAPEPGQPENPASTGFATSQDPPEWENAAERAETMSMQMWSSFTGPQDFARKVMDHYRALQADPQTDAETMPYGYDDLTEFREDRKHGELRDEPEPALPSTTADEEDIVEPPGERYRAQMRAEVPAEDTQLGGLNPTAAVSDAVASFQASAGARALQSNGGPNDMDIAQAARQHLAGQGGIQRTALKDFNSAEQMELITEGVGQRARNFEDLRIEDTHYAALAQALAAEAALADPDDLFD